MDHFIFDPWNIQQASWRAMFRIPDPGQHVSNRVPSCFTFIASLLALPTGLPYSGDLTAVGQLAKNKSGKIPELFGGRHGDDRKLRPPVMAAHLILWLRASIFQSYSSLPLPYPSFVNSHETALPISFKSSWAFLHSVLAVVTILISIPRTFSYFGS